MLVRLACSLAVVLALGSAAAAQNLREEAVRKDKENLQANENWIYNNLEDGQRKARAENKPLLVVIRCVP